MKKRKLTNEELDNLVKDFIVACKDKIIEDVKRENEMIERANEAENNKKK